MKEEIPTHLDLLPDLLTFTRNEKNEEAPFSAVTVVVQFHHMVNGALRGIRLDPSLIRDPQIYEKNKHLNTKIEQRAVEGSHEGHY